MQVKDQTKVYILAPGRALPRPLEKQGQTGPNQLGEPLNIPVHNPKFLAVQEHPQAAIRVFGQNARFLGYRGLGLGLGSLV